jgi:hypothetical protein
MADTYIQAVARSLNEARRSASGTLDASVAGCERDGLFNEDEHDVLRWVDRAKLRGLPCVGRGVGGVVTDGLVPGSDEHCDAMDRR